MLRRPTRAERRVLAWIDQTNASSAEDCPENVREWLEGTEDPRSAVVGSPIPTRQRRRAMTSKDRRPSSQSTASASCPKSPTSLSAGASSTAQAVWSDNGSRVIDPSSPGGGDARPRKLPAYSLRVVLASCFLCAALLPSLFALLVVAVFLTFAPTWSLIQTAQYLPLHREASIISLATDEDIPEPKGGDRNVFDAAFLQGVAD